MANSENPLYQKGKRELRVVARADLDRRGEKIIAEGKRLLTKTPLVEKRSWEQEDLGIIREFLVASAPYAHKKIIEGFWDSTLFCSILQRKLVEKALIADSSFPQDPREAEALGLLHDVGKLGDPAYTRSDILQDIGGRAIGIREEFFGKLHDVPGVLGMRSRDVRHVSDKSLESVIHDVADNFGKLNVPDIDALRTYASGQSKRYSENVLWPTEAEGLSQLDRGRDKVSVDLLMEEVDLLHNEYGIVLSTVRKEALEEFNQPENQEWLHKVKAAQRSSSQS